MWCERERERERGYMRNEVGRLIGEGFVLRDVFIPATAKNCVEFGGEEGGTP